MLNTCHIITLIVLLINEKYLRRNLYAIHLNGFILFFVGKYFILLHDNSYGFNVEHIILYSPKNCNYYLSRVQNTEKI